MTRFIVPMLALACATLSSACADSATEPDGRPAIGGLAAAVGGAEIVARINQQNEVEFSQFIPCANGGAGEDVSFSGTRHVNGQMLEDANGGLHLRFHTNPAGIQGVGQVTGTTYRAGGGFSQTMFIGADLPTVVTSREVYRYHATGGGARLIVEFVSKIVVNGAGDVAVDRSTMSVSCN